MTWTSFYPYVAYVDIKKLNKIDFPHFLKYYCDINSLLFTLCKKGVNKYEIKRCSRSFQHPAR